MDQERHDGDDEDHDQRQRVQIEGDLRRKASDGHPVPQHLRNGLAQGRRHHELRRQQGGEDGRSADRAHADHGHGPAR